ncbi:hypothetical protein [Pseudomonas entomophila]|nr:hypothetical protein [Pseudomonas entomophila]
MNGEAVQMPASGYVRVRRSRAARGALDLMGAEDFKAIDQEQKNFLAL